MKYEIDWIDREAEVLECDGVQVWGSDPGEPLVYRFWRGREEPSAALTDAVVTVQEPILLVNPQSVHSVRLLESEAELAG